MIINPSLLFSRTVTGMIAPVFLNKVQDKSLHISKEQSKKNKNIYLSFFLCNENLIPWNIFE